MKTRLILAVVVVVAVSTPLLGDISVGGDITIDTHWTAGSGPYIVTQDIVVKDNATLLIDPGVEVLFNPERQLRVVSGALVARGSETEKIRFAPNVAGVVTDADRWNSIWFGSDAVDASFDSNGDYLSGSVIEDAIIEYAGQGTTGLGTYDGAAIYAGAAAPYIANNLIQHNSRGGLTSHGSQGLRIVGNTVQENRIGLDLSHSSVMLKDNLINLNGALALAGGVKLHYSDVAFFENTISNNSSDPNRVSGSAIFSQGSIVTMMGDRIIGNAERALVFYSYATSYENDIVLSSDPGNPTSIYNNGGYDILNDMSWDGSLVPEGDRNIDARNVWWGTLSTAEISSRIYDHYDNSTKGIVFYEPTGSDPTGTMVPLPPAVWLGVVGLAMVGWIKRRQQRRQFVSD